MRGAAGAGSGEGVGELIEAGAYDLELDPESIPRLCADHGLTFG